MSRRVGWALAAVLFYVLAAVMAGRTGVLLRPLYDGLTPPPPYNWVDPPPEFAQANRPPAVGSAVVEVTGDGSAPSSVLTGDAQAQITLPEGAFPPRGDATEVRVTIEPVDPGTLAPPPRGLVFDGNAYDYRAAYRPGGEEAELRGSADVVLRYPVHATVVLALSDGRWERRDTTRIAASLAVVASTDRLGTFVAAAPPGSSPEGQGISLALLAYLSAGAALLGAALGYRARRKIAAQRALAGSAARRRDAARSSRPDGTRPTDATRRAKRRKKRR